MGLTISIGVDASNTSVQQQIDKFEVGDTILSPTDVASELAQAYLDYSVTGILLGADLSSGGIKSILDVGFISDNTPTTIDNIASAICGYWSSIDKVGLPAHGGTSVSSVVIDGNSKLSEMKTAIEDSITDIAAGGWTDFYNNTQAVVKTIPCSITELMPPTNSPQVFMETIT